MSRRLGGSGSRPSVGTVLAQFNLGVAYDGGGGIQEDDVEAARWFRLALADQGYADAQNSLGALHWEGLGVRRDLVEAARWLHLAADQGHALGQDNLDKVEARMTTEQIAEAQRLASEWQPTQPSR